MSIECAKCKKTNSIESNFCCRCGVSLNQKVKCPICLELKKTTVLMCGHTGCEECLERAYSIKKECFICRKPLNKCEKCNSFRVLDTLEKKECMDCKHITKILKTEEKKKIACIDCKSTRILYNSGADNWSCLDCFSNFSIKNNIASMDNISVTTKICSLCCSNDIEYKEFEYKCLNCGQENTKLKHITLEEYSRLKIKTREEVNKKIEKLYSCTECKSNNICKLVNLNDPLEEIYFCKGCNKSNIRIIENV